MANGIDWFRWHHGTAADPKFGLVAKKAGARFGDVVTVWALILEQASASLERGTFDPLDPETTDFMLGAEDGTTARILEAMTDRGLIEYGAVVRWDKRQPKREDQTAADRKRQQREREAAERHANDAHVTPCHTESQHVTPREEKSREEEIKTKAKSKASTASKSRKPAKTPLPADFSISEPVREWATKNGHANLQAHFDHFVGKARANGYCYVDWDQALQNAVREDWAKLAPQARASPPGYQTPNEKAKAWADRITGKTRQNEQPDFIDIN